MFQLNVDGNARHHIKLVYQKFPYSQKPRLFNLGHVNIFMVKVQVK